VSQVNPHSFLLSSFSLTVDVWSPPAYQFIFGFLKFLKAQFRDKLKNIVDFVFSCWDVRWGRGYINMLTQEYEGKYSDINILPWRGHLSPIEVSN